MRKSAQEIVDTIENELNEIDALVDELEKEFGIQK